MRYCRYLLLVLVAVGMLAGCYVLAQSTVSQSAAGFPPLELWKAEVLAGDSVALKAFYSTDPPVQVMANGVKTNVDADVSFWLGLKARTIQLETVAVLDRPREPALSLKRR
jgi:hypothetical protein